MTFAAIMFPFSRTAWKFWEAWLLNILCSWLRGLCFKEVRNHRLKCVLLLSGVFDTVYQEIFFNELIIELDVSGGFVFAEGFYFWNRNISEPCSPSTRSGGDGKNSRALMMFQCCSRLCFLPQSRTPQLVEEPPPLHSKTLINTSSSTYLANGDINALH